MSRSTFGGADSTALAIQAPGATGGVVRSSPNITGGTAWSAATAGTQYTDLIVPGGGATTVRTDANGYIIAMQGPDGVNEGMWVDLGSGTRFYLRTTDGLNATYVRKVAASGDTTGVTDKANIEAALAAGGALLDPAGLYWVSGLNLPTTLFHFDGRMAMLKLPNGSPAGTNTVKTNGFAALTGTGSVNGMTRSTICNLIVDGNKANNATGGKAMALYGWAYTISNVLCQNAHSDGLYTEWGADRTGVDVDTLMESHFSAIRCSNNDGNGWTFRGPHDSMIEGVVSKMNAAWGFVAESVSGGNGSGAHVRNLNAWNNQNGVRLAVSLTGYDVASSAVGTAILIDAGTGPCQLTDFIATGAIGFEVKSQFHRMSGYAVNCTTDALRINGAAGCMIDLKSSSCANAVNWLLDYGDNTVALSAVIGGTDTLETSVMSASTTLNLRRAGVGQASQYRFPGTFIATYGGANQVQIGAAGPVGQPAINIAGESIYQVSTGILQTGSWFKVGGPLLGLNGVAAWGHAAPGSQPAAPVTLADVIAIIRGCGLSA